MATHPAVADGNPFNHLPGHSPPPRLDLHYLRASGLAQARLQLAVLSGNRRRALEQIDRLVMIDKQLERVSQSLAVEFVLEHLGRRGDRDQPFGNALELLVDHHQPVDLLERVSEGLVAIAPPAEVLEDELDRERLAIASEKLALTAGVELPRLEPAFGAGLAAALSPEEPVEIVEEETLRSSLKTLALGAFALLVFCLGFGAALTQL